LCLAGPAWADPPTLLFVRGQGEAATVHQWGPGGAARPLGTGGPGWLAGPVSPDGRSVLVISVQGEAQRLLEVDRASGQATEMGPPARRLRQPRWVEGGAVVERLDAGDPQLWFQPRGGGPGRRLTAHATGAFDGAPAPDGGALVFVGHAEGSLDLWVQPMASGPARRLLAAPGDQLQPTWSPDGSRIAFLTEREGRLAVHTIAPDGTGERTTWRLPPGATEEIVPEQGLAWSPGGDALALVVRRADGRPEVRLLDARRGRELARSRDAGAAEQPAWLTDGTGVVMTVQGDAGPELATLSRAGAQARLPTGPGWLPRVVPPGP
jgi:dipeptidyl aminopeptidase/acylaminoacyl peptidase